MGVGNQISGYHTVAFNKYSNLNTLYGFTQIQTETILNWVKLVHKYIQRQVAKTATCGGGPISFLPKEK